MEQELNFIKTIVNLSNDYDFEIRLYLDKEKNKLLISIDDSDLFGWGYSSDFDLNFDDVELLEKTCQEVKTLCKDRFGYLIPPLFVCRYYKLCPQGAYFETIPDSLVELFKKCGEEQEVGIGNPVSIAEVLNNRNKFLINK